MKTKMGLFLFLALFLPCLESRAITNTMIAVSGTNIVLYWPSYGYESYLIQYRQTLSLTDSWSQLTNAYPANSTNFTTYTIYGVIPPPATGGGGGSGSGGGSLPSPDMAMAGGATSATPMVVPADGVGNPVPLAIYPPGFNLTGYDILNPATGELISGSNYEISTVSEARPMYGGITPMDGGATPDDSTNDTNGPTTGFFRVFHIPNWLTDFSGYVFDGPTFIPVDYAAPDAPTNYVEASQV